MSHISFNNAWIGMKFGIQVEGQNIFNLSSDRFLNIQNGSHFEVITKIHGIGHKYNSVNNAWIHLRFKLYITNDNAFLWKNYQFNTFIMAAIMLSFLTITENCCSTLNKDDIDKQVVSECRYWNKESSAIYRIEISWAVLEIRLTSGNSEFSIHCLVTFFKY